MKNSKNSTWSKRTKKLIAANFLSTPENSLFLPWAWLAWRWHSHPEQVRKWVAARRVATVVVEVAIWIAFLPAKDFAKIHAAEPARVGVKGFSESNSHARWRVTKVEKRSAVRPAKMVIAISLAKLRRGCIKDRFLTCLRQPLFLSFPRRNTYLSFFSRPAISCPSQVAAGRSLPGNRELRIS